MVSLFCYSSFFASCRLKCTLKTGNVEQLPDRKEKHDLQKEVLQTLFTVPERFEEPKKSHPIREVRRSSAHRRVVEEPLKETTIEHRPVIRRKQVSENGKLLLYVMC